tara:strand:+ start:967 stop:1695 length:729 start_codon:yes stop_codon:yes gene_type:complete
MKLIETNRQAAFEGIKNAFGIPALLLISAMTGFGSLAQEQGFSIYMSILSTILIWGLPGQVVHVELYGMGAPLIAVALGVAGVNARFMPMTISMMHVFEGSNHDRKWNYFLAHMISINTWAEMLQRKDQIDVNLRISYFLGFSFTCMLAGVIGVFQGYLLFENMPNTLSICLVFLVPIYFGLIMSNTKHLPFLIAFILGSVLGPLINIFTKEWSLILAGIISGSIVYFFRIKISNFDFLKKK